MTDKKTYRVIVSDRAKRMLGTHIRFLAQVNPQAATAKKKELLSAMRSLSQMPHRFHEVSRESRLPPEPCGHLSAHTALRLRSSYDFIEEWICE